MELTISNDYDAEALAVFCKRVTFDDAYRRADGETEEERKAMAYRIISAVGEVGMCLADAGFSPR